MFNLIYELLVATLRANPKIILDGQHGIDCGETFCVNFTAKRPAPNNQAEIDLSDVFAQFPEGFAVQRIADVHHTAVRLPVGPRGSLSKEEYRGTFMLTVTKVDLERDPDGLLLPTTKSVDDALDDIIKRYSELPEAKQKIFIKFAQTFLKGITL